MMIFQDFAASALRMNSIVMRFVFIITCLGISLTTSLILNWGKNNEAIEDVLSQIQQALLDLLDESSAQLALVRNDSVHYFSLHAAKQDTKNIALILQNQTDWIQYGVNQMADDWRNREIDSVDMDRSLVHLWSLFSNMGTCISMHIAGQTHGNFMSLSSRATTWQAKNNTYRTYFVGVQLHAAARCSFCGNTSDLFRSGPLAAYQATFPTTSSGPFDARTQPWYQTALALGGPGAWSAVHADGATGALVASFAKVARAADGSALGVVAMDLALDDLSRSLRDARDSFIATLPAATPAAVAADVSLFLLDAAGRLLATSIGDLIADSDGGVPQPASWQDTVRRPAARRGLAAVTAACHGNLAALFAPAGCAGAIAADGGGLQLFPDPELVVTAMPNPDADGFAGRTVAVCIFPSAVYRGQVQLYPPPPPPPPLSPLSSMYNRT
jgi:hypothetical protein